MKEKAIKIHANVDEITMYKSLGEALMKTQVVEQALSHSITLKLNPDETKERADKFLRQQLRYTLGQAIKIVNEKNYTNYHYKKKLMLF
ncbi:hypothetical protein ACJVDH_07550 [Pedobacter sp. AW1-32]|uniref:hypothetical protein n=1 Tax=Pedobacter sp. AW1-32 TaxID=3383026 RepID=UPI003FF1479C